MLDSKTVNELKGLKNKLDNNSTKNKFNNIVWGDIYFAKLDGNQGSEQGGIRPVIVIGNDIGSNYSPTVIVACITSRMTKAKLPTHVEISGYGLEKDSVILMETPRQIDKRRLISYIGRVDDINTINKIERAIMINTDRHIGHETKVRKDIKKYIYKKFEEICHYNTTIDTLNKLNISTVNIENIRLKEKTNLMRYCDNNNIDYNNIRNDYLLKLSKSKMVMEA